MKNLNVVCDELYLNRFSCLLDKPLVLSSRMHLSNLKRKEPIRSYDKADSCSLNSVLFIKNDEIAAANMRGQLKIWDVRSNTNTPTSTCILSNDQVSIGCVAKHPTQQHILCSGSEDGILAFWDLRSQVHPITLLKAHEQSVSEIHFHQQQPDHLEERLE